MKNTTLLSVTIAMIFSCSSLAYSAEATYDMRTLTFDTTTTHAIKAQWLFWWNQLIDPAAIDDNKAPLPTDIVMMPQHWTDYKLNGTMLPAKGCATYALKILLPDNAIYGIYLDHMVTAYRLYINGVEVANNGKVSKDLSAMRNECRHQAIYFTPKNKTA